MPPTHQRGDAAHHDRVGAITLLIELFIVAFKCLEGLAQHK